MSKSKSKFEMTLLKNKKTINLTMFDMIVFLIVSKIFFLKKIYEQQNVFQTDTCLQFKEVKKNYQK
jgi:hypothetical protein